MKPPTVLVDGSSHLYRAFDSPFPLRSGNHSPFPAVQAVTSKLIRIQKDFLSSKIIVAFDADGKTFRHEVYPDYKAKWMSNEFHKQVDLIKNIAETMGFPLVVLPGIEAKDILGSLVTEANRLKTKILLSTADDYLPAQLVNEDINLLDVRSGDHLNRKGVIDKFGVAPEYIIDYFALLGVKSDNVPGAYGIGEKSAVSLIQGLGDLNSIYRQLECVADLPFRGSKKAASILDDYADMVNISYQLAQIKTDVDLPQSLNDLNMGDADTDLLRELFLDLGFTSLVNELPPKVHSQLTPSVMKRYQTESKEEQKFFDAPLKIVLDEKKKSKSIQSSLVKCKPQSKLSGMTLKEPKADVRQTQNDIPSTYSVDEKPHYPLEDLFITLGLAWMPFTLLDHNFFHLIFGPKMSDSPILLTLIWGTIGVISISVWIGNAVGNFFLQEFTPTQNMLGYINSLVLLYAGIKTVWWGLIDIFVG